MARARRLSKLPPYVLPVLPALALLTAAREMSEPTRFLDFSAWLLLASAAVLIAFTLLAPHILDNPIMRSAAYEARPMAVAFALTAALAALFYHRAAGNEQLLQSFAGLAVGWFLGLALIFATIGHDSSLRSGRDLAASIPSAVATDAPIYSVQTYDQTLPFHLRRTLVLVD